MTINYSTDSPTKSGSDASVEHPVDSEITPANQIKLLSDTTASLPDENHVQSNIPGKIPLRHLRRIAVKKLVIISIIGMAVVALFLLVGTFFFVKKRVSKSS